MGTTSNNAAQSSLLTQFKTSLYSIRSVKATKESEATDAQQVILFFFDTIIQPIMQKIMLNATDIIHIEIPPLQILILILTVKQPIAPNNSHKLALIHTQINYF